MECQQDDMELILRFREGDRAAMDALIERYRECLYQYARRLARNSDDAADIVAETFLRVYRCAGSFRGNAQFSTWLYRVVLNCYLDHRRRSERQPQWSLDNHREEQSVNLDRELCDEAPTPQDHVEEGERSQRLWRAIECLPEGHRRLILLFHTEGRSYDEIATVLDLPLGTVKSRMNRARLALRYKLAGEQELFETALGTPPPLAIRAV